MLKITKHQERQFEKQHILKQKEKYLNTDSINKYKSDKGYRAKIDLIVSFLEKYIKEEHQLILDLGANTAGESEVLVSKGYNMVATDINEIALSISNDRCNKYGRKSPKYFAADSHSLPFANSTFDAIITFEVLHHFEELDIVMSEISRVLKPGGKIFAFEPYALNPYRRLAELRFLILGSIERSFTVKGLKLKFVKNGLEVIQNYKYTLPPSEWKKNHSPKLRAFLKELYYKVRVIAPSIFGDLVFIGQKSKKNGESGKNNIKIDIEDNLICPISHDKIVKVDGGYLSQGPEKYFYKDYNNIPVLISSDAVVAGN